jgi:amino acid transporter/nucleotide-binding universal stress UspA family protein
VYASARKLSVPLSVIGATLLYWNYIVTATLSVVEAFHYFGLSSNWTTWATILTLGLLGVINWFGAKSAGRFALVMAVVALGFSAIIGVLCLPFLGEGLKALTWTAPGQTGLTDRWHSLVAIMLAMSGVEAVANMTSLMKEPVDRTAKSTIWPVLVEVIVFNLIFGIAIAGLPHLVNVHKPHYYSEIVEKLPEFAGNAQAASDAISSEIREYRDTAVKILAIESGQHWMGETAGLWFGRIAAIGFGLLLLSAGNTAIMAMVSVLYSMAQDREIPGRFTRLNYSGVPSFGLIASVVIASVLTVVAGTNVQTLAELYAVGVVGAISINILCCAYNRELVMGRYERFFMWAVGLFMFAVEVTIIVDKQLATLYAGVMIAGVLILRWAYHAQRREEEPASGWLAELRLSRSVPAVSGPRIMLAARGRDQAEYAVDLARRQKGVLFAIFVRTLRVIDAGPRAVPKLEQDRDAQEALGSTALLAKTAGVPFVPIYVSGGDVVEEILDYTVTYGCDTLVMGKTRRTVFSRALAGDVVAQVAAQLPPGITLLTRAPGSTEPVEQVVTIKDEDDAGTPPTTT